MALNKLRLLWLVVFIVVATSLLIKVGVQDNNATSVKLSEISAKEEPELYQKESFQRAVTIKENRDEVGHSQTENEGSTPPQNPESEIERRRFFTRQGFIERTKRPMRIAVVRHPLVRLVSAFRDKFRNGSSLGTEEKQYRHMMAFLKASGLVKEETKSLRRNPGKLLNFTVFLRLVIQQHTNPMWDPFTGWHPNNHWNSGVRFCSFCEVNYDYIVKTETYLQDVDYILRLVGEHDLRLRVVNKRGKTSDPFLEYTGYYEEVPAEVLSAIYQIFKYDLAFFDYGLTPYIEKVLRNQGMEII